MQIKKQGKEEQKTEKGMVELWGNGAGTSL